MSDIVTFPLFVTANEYDTRSLTRDTVAGVALLTTDNAGACAIVTVPKKESPHTNCSEPRIPAIVTFPVFVTTNEYDTRSPTREAVAGVTLLTTDSAEARVTVTTPKDQASDTVRAGAVPPVGVGA